MVLPGELANYVLTDPNVFSAQVHAQIHSTPGDAEPSIIVSWRLTYPSCMTSVCVHFENRQGDLISTECPSDVTTNVVLKSGLECNIYVTASVMVVAGGRGNRQRATEVYYGG